MKRKGYKYYGQNGEDFLLWNFFQYKNQGFFVDVGAFDGRHFSNTYSFEERGWRGICIEPHPTYFPYCRANRPRSICLNVACVHDDSIPERDFYAEEIGCLSGLTIDEEDIKRRYQNRGLNFRGFEKVKVQTVSLNSILEEHLPENEEIDFIGIDVEGSEMEVLKGLDLNQYAPRIIVAEANSEDAKNKLILYLTNEHGYKYARSLSINLFFAATNEDVEALNRININCDITEVVHPLGKKYTIESSITKLKKGRTAKPLQHASALALELRNRLSAIIKR